MSELLDTILNFFKGVDGPFKIYTTDRSDNLVYIGQLGICKEIEACKYAPNFDPVYEDYPSDKKVFSVMVDRATAEKALKVLNES